MKELSCKHCKNCPVFPEERPGDIIFENYLEHRCNIGCNLYVSNGLEPISKPETAPHRFGALGEKIHLTEEEVKEKVLKRLRRAAQRSSTYSLKKPGTKFTPKKKKRKKKKR